MIIQLCSDGVLEYVVLYSNIYNYRCCWIDSGSGPGWGHGPGSGRCEGYGWGKGYGYSYGAGAGAGDGGGMAIGSIDGYWDGREDEE